MSLPLLNISIRIAKIDYPLPWSNHEPWLLDAVKDLSESDDDGLLAELHWMTDNELSRWIADLAQQNAAHDMYEHRNDLDGNPFPLRVVIPGAHNSLKSLRPILEAAARRYAPEEFENSHISSGRVGYIKKEKNKHCVRSEKNPDWSGGCYDTKKKPRKDLVK